MKDWEELGEDFVEENKSKTVIQSPSKTENKKENKTAYVKQGKKENVKVGNDDFEVVDEDDEIAPVQNNQNVKAGNDDFELVDEEEEVAPKKQNQNAQNGNQNVQNNQVQPQFWVPKHLSPELWMTLLQREFVYNNTHGNENVKAEHIADWKNQYYPFIDARIDALEADGKYNSEENKECIFIRKALKNGWLPSDFSMLVQAYETIHSLPQMEEGNIGKGLDILSQIENTKITTVADRHDLVDVMMSYFAGLKRPEGDAVSNILGQKMMTTILPKEYPNDPNWGEEGQKYGNGIKLENVLLKHSSDYNKLVADHNRSSEEYVMAYQTEAEMEEFTRHKGHLHNNITKGNRQALKEVFGEEIYDDIDEMHKGNREDRKVKIYHSYGNQLMKEGKDVLELDFAGSGFQDVAHAHKYRGGLVQWGDEDQMAAQYGGHRVPKPGGGHFKYIRSEDKKVKDNAGQTHVKTRYSIAGPTPDTWKPLMGVFNLGDYSIESTKIYGRDFAAKFLEPHFRNWRDGVEQPHELHINLTGHSRGAVSEGECIKLIQAWIRKYADKNPQFKDYEKYVHYDAFFNETVPGVVTNLRLGSNDLSGITNLNATVYCSMAQEHGDFLYPLQQIKGAQRLIIDTTEHTNMKKTDTTQMSNVSDKKKHQEGFYDAETGEYFRGSGVNQMPKGVYISDEKKNLIRISSYSQLAKVIDAVYEGNSKQRIRVRNIHRMARDWFLQNSLESSFLDAEEKKAETEKNNDTMDRILASPNKRLAPVKQAIRDMKKSLEREGREPVTNEEMLAVRDKLIEACRAYMKKTSVPREGESAYRMNLVSDLLSFSMKEKNYQKLMMQKLANPDAVIPLDEKIRAHKNRLENKEGRLERKLEKATKRYNRDKSILDSINKVKDACEKGLTELNKTTGILWNSDTYNNFHAMLTAGTKLGNKTTIKEFIGFLKKMTEVSDAYVNIHTGPSPFTRDGKLRLKHAKIFAEMGKEIGRKTENSSKFIADKTKPAVDMVKQRQAEVTKLQHQVSMKQIANAQKGLDIKAAATQRINLKNQEFQKQQEALKKQELQNKKNLQVPKGPVK